MTISNWFGAQTFVLGGRSKVSRPIENNTRVVTRGEDFAVQLHDTDVVTFHQDGSVTLDSGGWLTVTTKARMNEYLGDRGRVYSDRGKWFFYPSTRGWGSLNTEDKVRYFDGIRIASDGTILNPPDPKLEERKAEAEVKMRKRIDAYVNGYMKALANGMPVPSGGDCWDCSFIVSDGPDKGKPLGDVKSDRNDHLISHLTERYYVPTLLWNAMKERGYRDVALTMGMFLDITAWEAGTMRVRREWGSDKPDTSVTKIFRTTLGKYLRKRLIPTVAV